MEQHTGKGEVEPTLDRGKAEEALLIAARLQLEHRERLTLTQLKQTAAEVDIDPEFVEQAVKLVSRQPVTTKQVMVPAEDTSSKDIPIGITVLVVEFFFARLIGPWPVLQAKPYWALAIILAVALGLFSPRKADFTKKGLLFITVSLGFWALVHALPGHVNAYYDNFWYERIMILAAVQAAAYSIARWVRSRYDGSLEEKPTDRFVRSDGL